MNGTGGIEFEWVAACLAPHDIAPHPNFHVDQATGPERLALLIQFEWEAFREYSEPDGQQAENHLLPSIVLDFLTAAQKSMEQSNVTDGLDGLMATATAADASLGMRTAASLLAASVCSELDKPDAALPLLTHLVESIDAQQPTSPIRLAKAALLQQAGLRALEANLVEESQRFAQAVLDVLAEVRNDWEQFSVSKGISWTSNDTQNRLVELIQTNAQSLLLTASDHLRPSWQSIVRAPFPAAGVRLVRDALSATTALIEDMFDERLSVRLKTRLGGDPTLRSLYAALYNAELTGDLADSARMRQLLGRVFAIRIAGDPSKATSHEEAVRLLRQGDAEEGLRDLLDLIRQDGPLDLLGSSAAKLVDARSNQAFVTPSDMALLEKAADVLPASDTARAVQIAVRYARQTRTGRVKGAHVRDWKLNQTSFNTIAALIRGNPETDMTSAAKSVLQVADVSILVGDQITFNSLVEVAAAIAWESVDTEVKTQWLSLLAAASLLEHIPPTDLVSGYQALGERAPTDTYARLAGHDFVAALLNGQLGDAATEDQLNQAVAIIADSIESIQREAASGRFTGYAHTPFGMAGLLISVHHRDDLWPALLPALLDERVPKEEKMRALEALLVSPAALTLPSDVGNALSNYSIPRAVSDERLFFTLTAESFNASLRNFYIGFDLVPTDDVRLPLSYDIASRDVRTRIKAELGCRLLAYHNPDLEWPRVLLVQLSYDQSARVRHVAGHGLAILSAFSDPVLSQTIRERTEQLLGEPGAAAPIGVLKGLRDAVREYGVPTGSLWCEDRLGQLAVEHPSREVQRSAQKVMKLYLASKSVVQ